MNENDIIYIDTSVILSLFFYEDRVRHFQQVIRDNELVSSQLLIAETYGALRREDIPLDEANLYLDAINFVYPDSSVAEVLKKIYTSDYCKGTDALHLATACYLQGEIENLYFLTADKQQKKVAKQIGLTVL